MQGSNISTGTMVAAIAVAVALFGGLGWYFFMRSPAANAPAFNAQPPAMPPGGGSGSRYGTTGSGQGNPGGPPGMQRPGGPGTAAPGTGTGQ